MIPLRMHPDAARLPLADEIRGLGGVWILCDARGVIVDAPPAAPGDLVAAVLTRSRAFHQVLRSVVPALAADRTGSIAEPMPGLYLIASRMPNSDRAPVGIAVIPTAAFAYGDDLLLVASSAGLDAGAIREQLLGYDPIEPREIARLAPLIRFAHRADVERDLEIGASDAVGWQLAETYEEINLLYTLVSGMSGADEPAPFVQLGCSELVRSLGFAWAAVSLLPPLSKLIPDDGAAVAGEVPFATADLSQVVKLLLTEISGDGPRVFPRGHKLLGQLRIESSVAVCPIRCNGHMAGVLVAGERRDRDGEIPSIDLKLADATAGHLAIYLENANLYRDLDKMFLGTLEAIVAAIDAKDPYTRGHSQRVAALSRDLARSIGIGDPTLKQIHIAGLVHDVGKIGVPEAVLSKPGRLNDTEFDQIRMHPEVGWRILHDIPQFSGMLDGVLSHHERWDGRGYPNGLAGREIPLIARIISLADSFDAMSSNRTYRASRPRAAVFEEIQRCAGSQFDPDLVVPFCRLDFGDYDRLHAEHEARALTLAAVRPPRREAA
ncbi:MAG: HD-GYP domain-containing protein [Phycisphaerae bacterium]|nr:HD-GYP domain-containing protein [Phycisphaerae bacterium]